MRSAEPSSVAPSNTCTELIPLASLAVPDRPSVLSLVTPPLVMVVVAPVSVLIVLLIVTLGGVVSTVPVLIVAVTADVVVVLPAVSVAWAVKLWLPLGSAGVV